MESHTRESVESGNGQIHVDKLQVLAESVDSYASVGCGEKR